MPTYNSSHFSALAHTLPGICATQLLVCFTKAYRYLRCDGSFSHHSEENISQVAASSPIIRTGHSLTKSWEAVPDCGLSTSPQLPAESTFREHVPLSNHQDNLLIRVVPSLGGSTGVATSRSPQLKEPEHLGLPIAERVRGRRTSDGDQPQNAFIPIIDINSTLIHIDFLTDRCLIIKHLQVEADSSQT